MHPLNPVLSSAVLTEIDHDRLDAAGRAAARSAVATRRSRFAAIRGRIAARRGGSPPAASRRHVPARAGRA
jgi:hypothetical protein